MEFTPEGPAALVPVGHDEDRVVSGDRAQDVRMTDSVDHDGDPRRVARRRL